jgi:hypothetical protein
MDRDRLLARPSQLLISKILSAMSVVSLVHNPSPLLAIKLPSTTPLAITEHQPYQPAVNNHLR